MTKIAITATGVKMTIVQSVQHIARNAMKQYAWAVQANVKYVMSQYVQAVFGNVLNAEFIFAKDVSLKIYVQIVTN